MTFIMSSTSKEIVYVVEEYFTGQRSIVVTQKRFQQDFGKREVPSRKVIPRAVTNFRMTGDARKKKSPGRFRTSRNAESCERVEKTITQSPFESTGRLAQQGNLLRTSVNRIFKKDLHLYPYKVQVAQQLHPPDKLQKKAFTEWFNNMCREEEYFLFSISQFYNMYTSSLQYFVFYISHTHPNTSILCF